MAFTVEDAGCYADGAAGHQYCREVLAELLTDSVAHESKGLRLRVSWVAETLRGAMPDDAWDEEEALDRLSGYCDEGCYFTFDDGDLLLVAA